MTGEVPENDAPVNGETSRHARGWTRGWARGLRKVRRLVALTATAMGLLLFVAVGARADMPENDIPVRVKPFSITFKTEAGRSVKRVLYVYLIAADMDAVRFVCGSLPQIKNAVLMTSYNQVVPDGDKPESLRGLATKLYDAMTPFLHASRLRAVNVALSEGHMARRDLAATGLGGAKECRAIDALPSQAVSSLVPTEDKPAGGTDAAPDEPAPDMPSPYAAPPTKPADEAAKPAAPDQQPFQTHEQMQQGFEEKAAQSTHPTGAACTQSIPDLWKPVWVTLAGKRHWLSRVFTLDQDNDGRTDNVRFVLKGEDEAETVMDYFATRKQPGVEDIPVLALRDPSRLPWICFGNYTFAKPSLPLKPMEQEERPDLAKEAKARILGKADETEAKDDGASWRAIFGALGGLAVVGALAIGGYALFLHRQERRRRRRRSGKERRHANAARDPDRRNRSDRRRIRDRRDD